MKIPVLFVSCGIIFGLIATSRLRADQMEMQNGDRYIGKILSVSADTVVLQSEVLGKVALPRAKVANLAFGSSHTASSKAVSNVAPVAVPTNLPDVASLAALAKTHTNSSASVSNSPSNAEVVKQIRDQMLSGSPAAASKYNELATGLLTGKLNMDDIRREAKSSADELRKLKSELGPEASSSLDGYLEILDNFLKESGSTNTSPSLQPKTKTPAR